MPSAIRAIRRPISDRELWDDPAAAQEPTRALPVTGLEKARRFGALKFLPAALNVAHSHPVSLTQRKVRDVASSIQPL